jgi:hypothetical protein
MEKIIDFFDEILLKSPDIYLRDELAELQHSNKR